MMAATLELFERTDKGIHGAIWWVGNWECRNRNGYFQDREGGKGAWSYVIYAFGDTDCTVYQILASGEIVNDVVPIDAKDRITIHGRKYGRANWRH